MIRKWKDLLEDLKGSIKILYSTVRKTKRNDVDNIRMVNEGGKKINNKVNC